VARESLAMGGSFTDFVQRQELPKLEAMLAAMVPIVKVDKPGSFMIGTEIKQVILRGNAVVRVGGGFLPLE